jgi:hypothetical protein
MGTDNGMGLIVLVFVPNEASTATVKKSIYTVWISAPDNNGNNLKELCQYKLQLK